jgi:hypothetical protein
MSLRSQSNGDNFTPSSTSLLKEWAKVKLTHDSWKDVLASAVDVSISFYSRSRRWIDPAVGLQFTVPRVTIYRAIYERLETIDHA